MGRSCYKYHFCRDKSFVTTEVCMLRQIFVTTNIILLWQNMCFVTANTCLLQQKFACHTITFVATKLCLLQQYLSWQKFSHDKQFCCNKRFVLTSIFFVATKTCFVTTSTHLSFVKTFVSTKMILVAALPSDNNKSAVAASLYCYF